MLVSSYQINAMPREYWPQSVAGTARIMAEAQGTSFWQGGPVQTNAYPPQKSQSRRKSTSPTEGAANRIPLEIALKISEHLNVRDLARGAVAWRPLALASHANPEFIRTECARFSLLSHAPFTCTPEVLRQVRERMAQYNFAWSTLQYSYAQSFTLPSSDVMPRSGGHETPWAGSHEWRSGNHFMGESNGYVYDARSWEVPGPRMLGRVCVTQIPSLRVGEMGLKSFQFDVNLTSGYMKAVTVDPVGKRVGILEYNNGYTDNPCTRIPVLHVRSLKEGQFEGSVEIRTPLSAAAEVYHMEFHGKMVCIVANHSTINGTFSEMVIQDWTVYNGRVFVSCRSIFILPRVSPYLTIVSTVFSRCLLYWFSVHHARPLHHDRKGGLRVYLHDRPYRREGTNAAAPTSHGYKQPRRLESHEYLPDTQRHQVHSQ
ncbi:hypothetical protein DFH07DRAFT_821975 [Mycena maculata]|uniref:F-box domain-containing protein n=1 Tax=Mycena maculata TaxID=230809 RepID=A0AAD7J400_9AGAR|nr:hypothetical protein DFH07DRAFT_821975 [Mycena maculata]